MSDGLRVFRFTYYFQDPGPSAYSPISQEPINTNPAVQSLVDTQDPDEARIMNTPRPGINPDLEHNNMTVIFSPPRADPEAGSHFRSMQEGVQNAAAADSVACSRIVEELSARCEGKYTWTQNRSERSLSNMRCLEEAKHLAKRPRPDEEYGEGQNLK